MTSEQPQSRPKHPRIKKMVHNKNKIIIRSCVLRNWSVSSECKWVWMLTMRIRKLNLFQKENKFIFLFEFLSFCISSNYLDLRMLIFVLENKAKIRQKSYAVHVLSILHFISLLFKWMQLVLMMLNKIKLTKKDCCRNHMPQA